jgi:hypothetical protein
MHHFAAAIGFLQVVGFQPTGDHRLAHGLVPSRVPGLTRSAGMGADGATGAVAGLVFRGVSTARTRWSRGYDDNDILFLLKL